MPGVFAAEDRTRLRHPRLDERVADPGAHGPAAVLGDDLGNRSRGDQVMDDRRARLSHQFPHRDQRGQHRGRDDFRALVHHEAAVGVTVEGKAEVGARLGHRALQVPQVGGLDRIRLVVRERAVQLEVQRHQRDGKPFEDRGHGVPGHPVARVHRHGEGADPGQVDQ